MADVETDRKSALSGMKKQLWDAAFTAGADAERARIREVEEQSLPGLEDLVQTLKFDGKTTGDQAAVQVLTAWRNAKREWANNPRLAREFGSLEFYLPYRRAELEEIERLYHGDGQKEIAADLKMDSPTAISSESVITTTQEEDAPMFDEKAARDEWTKNPELCREFSSEASYVGFRRAEAAGLINVCVWRKKEN